MAPTLHRLAARDPALAYEAALDALVSELFAPAPRLRVMDQALRQLYRCTPDSERMPARRPLPVGPWGPAWRARLRTAAGERSRAPARRAPHRSGPSPKPRRAQALREAAWP